MRRAPERLSATAPAPRLQFDRQTECGYCIADGVGLVVGHMDRFVERAVGGLTYKSRWSQIQESSFGSLLCTAGIPEKVTSVVCFKPFAAIGKACESWVGFRSWPLIKVVITRAVGTTFSRKQQAIRLQGLPQIVYMCVGTFQKFKSLRKRCTPIQVPCLTITFHPNKSVSVPFFALRDDAIVSCGTDIPDVPRQATLRDSVKDIAKQNEMSRFRNRPLAFMDLFVSPHQAAHAPVVEKQENPSIRDDRARRLHEKLARKALMGTCVCLASVAYGAIHFLCWINNFVFPSDGEMWAWMASASSLIFSGVLWAILVGLDWQFAGCLWFWDKLLQ